GGGSGAGVSRDQLAEIDRDLGAGLIGSSEAEAARVEIGRRLLAAADDGRDAPAGSNVRLRRTAAVVAIVGLPILAIVIYLPLGSPWLGDFPLVARVNVPEGKQPFESLVAQVEQHLEKNPTAAPAWTVLPPLLAPLPPFH